MGEKIVPKHGKGLMNRFKKGEVTNPKGRKPGKNRATIIREVFELRDIVSDRLFKVLQKKIPHLHKNMTAEQMMTISLVHKAIVNGDVRAYKELMDSCYGSAKQSVEHDLSKNALEAVKIDKYNSMNTEDLQRELAKRTKPVTRAKKKK